jgi:hypothetical protein
MAYVSSDGNYGGDYPIVFEQDDLTAEQWDILTEMHDNDRYEYVLAIIEKDTDTVETIEAQYV